MGGKAKFPIIGGGGYRLVIGMWAVEHETTVIQKLAFQQSYKYYSIECNGHFQLPDWSTLVTNPLGKAGLALKIAS